MIENQHFIQHLFFKGHFNSFKGNVLMNVGHNYYNN